MTENNGFFDNMDDNRDENIIDLEYTYKIGAIPALSKFRKKKTFKLNTEERFEAMKELIEDLSAVYEIETPTLRMESINGGSSGLSSYSPVTNTIVMRGKLSIITLLHEFAHAKGEDEHEARVWSVNLFRRVYPEQFSRLRQVGNMFIL